MVSASGGPAIEVKIDETTSSLKIDETQRVTAETTTSSISKTRVVAMKRSGDTVIQSCDVYIGRACNMGGWKLRASPWANPFTVKECKFAA